MIFERKVLMTRIVLVSVVACFVACAAKSKLVPNTDVSAMNNSILYVPIIKTITPHDTVPKKRSDAELQAYLNSQYKLNYEQLFAPQFNKMNSTIDKLADGNHALTDLITAMRKRAILHNDSMQIVNGRYIKQAIAYQAQSIQFQQEAITARKEYDTKIQEQIHSNDRLTVICLVGLIVLFSIVLSLFLYCVSRFNKINKVLSHA